MGAKKKASASPRLRVAILGLGKAGGSLLRSFRDAGVVDMVASARRISLAFAKQASGVDVLFLAVPDDAVGNVVASLSRFFSPHAHPSLVVHLSGASDLSVLHALPLSIRRASFHPLDALDGKTPLRKGTLIAIDAGAPKDVRTLFRLARAHHLLPIRIHAADRVRYHAGAVVAANLATALLFLGSKLLRKSGVPPALARKSLAKLLQSTARNAERLPLHKALTGPVARKDQKTMERHLSLLDRDDPQTARVYRLLTEVLWEVRQQKSY